MADVGFIGLGTMGKHMARNLIKAGHRLTFFARKKDVVDEFTALGARAAESPAAVARASEFIITIVTADAQVREVALGKGGVIEGAAKGKVLIDMSTIGPGTTREVGQRLAAAGMSMLDAPVSGGPWGAEAATLAIMVGGDAGDFARARPLFDAMGKKIFHMGPAGSGQVVKLVNQMMAGAIMCLIGEGLTLAAKAGANLDQVADVVAASSGNSSAFEARAKKFVLAGMYKPGFMTELMRKDVGLALDLGRDLHVPMPLAAAALEQYTQAMSMGLAAEDFAAVAKVNERASGVKLSG
jgi:3-hydroxyisobutyrate dehydrogenase-like beta-hydroxyacid dehydrogenase